MTRCPSCEYQLPDQFITLFLSIDVVICYGKRRFRNATINHVTGTSVEESGYSDWAEGQPDGPPGDVDERCGSMLYNGQLNDIRCDKKAFFICEHEVSKPAADFNYRSGDRKRK